MSLSIAKKPRHAYALQLTRKLIDAQNDSGDDCWSSFKDSDRNFLRKFLFHRQVNRLFELIDILTVGSQFTPRVTTLRPELPEDRDSLQVLSELWVDLERFVMRTREDEEPDAHELYDLLADPHIREILVAYDDIANSRFTAEESELITLYAEPEPPSSEASLQETSVELNDGSLTNVAPIPQDVESPEPSEPTIKANDNALTRESSKVSKLVGQFETRQSYPSKSSKHHSTDEGSLTSLTHAKSSAVATHRPDSVRHVNSAQRACKPSSHDAASHSSQRSSVSKRPSGTKKHVPDSDTPPSPDKARSPRLSNPSNMSNHYPSSSLPNRSKRASKQSPDSDVPTNYYSLSNRRTSRSSSRQVRGGPGQTRRVRLRRDHPGEPIGITVALRTPSPPETGSSATNTRKQSVLTIQRVMAGSLADREGSLFPGDILLEYNGRPVHSLDEVYALIQQSSGVIECEFVVQTPRSSGLLSPGLQYKNNPQTKRFIRTFFDYNANEDQLMPTGDVGLSFKAGEVLELVDDQDPNWWQVRRLNDSGGKTRLIPSQTLEERRTAFKQDKPLSSAAKFFKKRYKKLFRAADSSELRLRADLWSYEEVVPWPQSTIPCLLLLGVTGVGRRNIKVLLAKADPRRFAFPVTCTTDPSASGSHFQLVAKNQMEADVRAGVYVEWGKANGHYYGIPFKAIRKIIASGRTAVLDCQPQTVHLLHQPEFNPCVVFIGAPEFSVAKSMMEEGLRIGVTNVKRTDAQIQELIKESQRFAAQNRHLYFHSLVNSDMNETVDRLIRLVSRIERQPSWIPSGWAYELSVPVGSVPGSTYVPGSSSLSALGIHSLPPSRSSTIARSILSGISEPSSESARRLARPPSILSAGPRNSHSQPRIDAGQPLYERRRRSQPEFRPMSPAIPEQDTPTESLATRSVEVSRRGGVKVLPTSSKHSGEVPPRSKQQQQQQQQQQQLPPEKVPVPQTNPNKRPARSDVRQPTLVSPNPVQTRAVAIAEPPRGHPPGTPDRLAISDTSSESDEYSNHGDV